MHLLHAVLFRQRCACLCLKYFVVRYVSFIRLPNCLYRSGTSGFVECKFDLSCDAALHGLSELLLE